MLYFYFVERQGGYYYMRLKKFLRFLIFVTTLFSFALSLCILVSAANDIDFSNLTLETTTRKNEELHSLLDLITVPSPIEPISNPTEETVITPETKSSLVETSPVIETTPTELAVEETVPMTTEVFTIEETQPEEDSNLIIFNNREYYIPFVSLHDEPMTSSSGYIEKIKDVPLYIQHYYKDVNYGGHGTVASHGCGVCSLAMVYSYLLDEEITPDEIAQKYGRYNTECGSDYGLFNNTDADYGLVMEKQTWNWNDVYSALLNRQVVIANPTNPSIFTDGGHYIVLAGLTDDGKIIVRDSSIYNYGNWSSDILKEGFKNGFDEKYLKYNCFPCFIYQPKDIEAVAARHDSLTNTDQNVS